jgi:hypothetical protein
MHRPSLKRMLATIALLGVLAFGLMMSSGFFHTQLALTWQAHAASHLVADGPDVIVGHH